MENVKRIKELINELNVARDSYYNFSSSILTDKEYDDKFDELSALEILTGVILSDSPTQSVGYTVKSTLEKVVHKYQLLSLDKTKDVDVIRKFPKGKDSLLMLKLDGLTICLTYKNRKLVKAETRGNGDVGEDVTHNAVSFGIPLSIPQKETLIVSGEAIITYKWFDKINSKLTADEKYKTPRNLASGSVRQLDSKVCKERHVQFVAFNVLEGINYNSIFGRLKTIEKYGFTIAPFFTYSPEVDSKHLEKMIDKLKDRANELGYPIDGLVMMIDDIEYGLSLGKTSHHFLNGLAYKFYDEEVETTLTDVEWTMGKTGILTPTAIFDTVELDGTDVSRASLHNISICENLKLGIGDTVLVYKANQIIPQIRESIDKSNTLEIPERCPICNYNTEIVQEKDSKVLLCTNSECRGKLLGRLNHFVSKPAMNIDGLSEETLTKFIELEWLNCLLDIYKLKEYKLKMLTLDGFGKKSVDKLLKSIEDSKNVKLENFINALGIPMIGKSASQTISKHFNGDWNKFEYAIFNHYDLTILDDIGTKKQDNIIYWYIDFLRSVDLRLPSMMNFELPSSNIDSSVSNSSLDGKTFVITGSLNHFANRDALKSIIEELSGKVSGSVSSKTNYLINNDNTSSSSKNKKANELGVKIITEEEFLDLIK